MALTRTLVFPATMQESLAFIENCCIDSREYILASSLAPHELREFFVDERVRASVLYLPYVTSIYFEQEFLSLVKSQGVDVVFTPHPVIRSRLSILRRESNDFEIVGDEVFHELEAKHSAFDDKCSLTFWDEPSGSVQDSLPKHLRIAVIKAVESIPGQSSLEKLAVIATIVWSAPLGDRIEIGAFWGRSSFVIALASKDGCPTICVDPWSNEEVRQPNSDALLSSVEKTLDMNLAFNLFLAHMAPFAPHRCNYIRDTSSLAISEYRSSSFVRSEIYGITTIHGKISILNIDGNHDYEKVKADLLLWTPYLTGKGWIFIDDYRWAFGDGPKKAADEWLYLNFKRVHTAYVVYGCLFIRLI